MRNATVRVSETAHSALRRLSAQSGEPMSVVLERAIDAYERQCLLERANAAYAALRADPDAWQEELQERAAWEATLGDDLDEREGDEA